MEPKIAIDWNKVDSLIECGNDGVRVAANLGIHPDTLYNRCESEKGCKWSTYSAQKREKGIARLLAKQYEVAMKGNTTMLVWVGKQMAGQKDGPDPDKKVPNEEIIKRDHEIASLRYEMLLKDKELHALRQTGNQLSRSDCSDQHLAGCNLIGQDTRQCEEASSAST